MDNVQISHDGWVLVCDGTKALVLKNHGNADAVALKTVEVFDEPQPPARDLGTSKPGRVYQSFSSARSSTEETDWHDENEIAFLIKIAGELDRLVSAHAIKNIIIVAPPRALGVLRQHLSTQVRAVVTAEIGKDLVRHSTHDIEKHLAA